MRTRPRSGLGTPETAGDLLRQWRDLRGLSQLDLALDAGRVRRTELAPWAWPPFRGVGQNLVAFAVRVNLEDLRPVDQLHECRLDVRLANAAEFAQALLEGHQHAHPAPTVGKPHDPTRDQPGRGGQFDIIEGAEQIERPRAYLVRRQFAQARDPPRSTAKASSRALLSAAMPSCVPPLSGWRICERAL